jgi:glucose/arabinose dehydrogenase
MSNIDPTARDPTSGRSQIRRFSIHGSAQTWLSGELLAYGIRNPAGFAFSPMSGSQLFVVENGASIDNATGLTSTFVNDNPADEMELVDLRRYKGAFFGFPDCTTIWNGSADPTGVPQYVNFARGQQFSLHLQPDRDDAWCAVVANNRPPVLSFQVRSSPHYTDLVNFYLFLQAHSVPLDIKFYEPRHRGAEAESSGAFPRSLANDAFVTFRGSFNRNPPTGYGVIQ